MVNSLVTGLLFFSEFRSGLYCSLYEVVEKTRSGSNLEGLLQMLEKEKLVSSCSPGIFLLSFKSHMQSGTQDVVNMLNK